MNEQTVLNRLESQIDEQYNKVISQLWYQNVDIQYVNYAIRNIINKLRGLHTIVKTNTFNKIKNVVVMRLYMHIRLLLSILLYHG